MFLFFQSHGSDVSHGSECVQGLFRATLGVASVFVHVVSRQDGEPGDVSPSH